ncbi:MAG: thioredoxin domain-containing protein [Myxococcota bacterium]|nr:thioredoxin domain-containing protein [Myxococcota bacterium]
MSSGNAVIIAATLMGLSIVGSAHLLVGSIDRASESFAALSGELVKSGNAEGKAAAAPAPAPPRRGPDPAKAYSVNTKGSPSKGGGENAPVTLIEFSDFQCPFCSRVTGTLDQVEKAYGDKVRIVFKHLPLRMHSKAPMAHAAAEAANRQGKFWPMHDLIFSNQRDLSEETYVVYAGQIGMNVDQFKKDMASASVKARVDADSREAEKLGVTGTPGFFVNGYFLSGAKPFSEFQKAIDAQLNKG